MTSAVGYQRGEVSTVLSTKTHKPEDMFQKVFSEVRDVVATIVKTKDVDESPAEILEWVKIVVQYNVPQGKQIRGRMVFQTYRKLVPSSTPGMQKLACVLGWIVEILQACSLVADDIMDNGVTRRGRPCWYLVNEKGNHAFNDAFILEHLAYQLLRHYFSKTEVYTELLDHLLGLTFKTVLGQTLDTRVGRKRDFDGYTEAMYDSIVRYKTAYYTIHLPIALALTFAGLSKRSPENTPLWKELEGITMKIGKLFQIQDDYLDCFADEHVLGKTGKDIEEGKCTWLFVTAKHMCNAEQFQVLKDSYGSDERAKVEIVRDLYFRVGVKNSYHKCVDCLRLDIIEMIQKLSNRALCDILNSILETICKRKF